MTAMTAARTLYRCRHVGSCQVQQRFLASSQLHACDVTDNNSLGKKRRKRKLQHSYQYLPVEGVPKVILKLIPSYYSFQKPFSYTGEAVHAAGDRDAVHLTSFSNSAVLSALCRRLQVPYDYVTGYSAALALKRLCELRDIGDDVIQNEDSIPQEVVKDVFASVQREAPTVENQTLLSLMFHRYAQTGFDADCFHVLNSEFERRLQESLFSVTELCLFSARLTLCPYTTVGVAELFSKIWTSICSRLDEVKPENLSDFYIAVPQPLAYNIYGKLESSLTAHLRSLDFRNIFLISKEVQLKAPRSKRELLKVSQWAKNVEKEITESEILPLLTDFQNSSFVDSMFLSVLSEYILSAHKKQLLSVDIIGAALPYYCLAKYYSESVLETVCEFYIQSNASPISSEHLQTILQAVGTFNYTPRRHRQFFSKVEQVLMGQFYQLDCVRLLEMVRYLIFVNRVPVHLQSYIFHPFFQGLLKDTSEKDYEQAVLDLHLLKTALTVRGVTIDQAFYPRPELKIFWNRLKVMEKGDKVLVKIYQCVLDVLQDQNTFTALARFTFNNVYYKVGLDRSNCVVPLNSSACSSYAVVMVILDSSFTKNQPNTMLGEDATNIRLLEDSGPLVIVVPFRLYMHLDNLRSSIREALYQRGITVTSGRGQATNGG